jgi:hypothetical protein
VTLPPDWNTQNLKSKRNPENARPAPGEALLRL